MRHLLDLPHIEQQLDRHQPITSAATADQREAAVALILKPSKEGLLGLFILRAKKAGDPWSGQMALPGGHREPGDDSLIETAQRETYEETGFNLASGARFLGALAGVRANPRSGIDLVVTPQIFLLQAKAVTFAPNEEVARVLWGNLDQMFSGTAKTQASFPEFQREGQFPGYRVDSEVVWGLTFRMLNDFFDLLR